MKLPVYARKVQNRDSKSWSAGKPPSLPFGLTFQGHV
ncbi:UNVERIFIED_CONTAM: hypothetical protein ABIE34_002918 [Jeotgalibacillus campisalis]